MQTTIFFMLALKGKGSVSKGKNSSVTKWRKVATSPPPLVTAYSLCKDKEKTSKPIIPIPIIFARAGNIPI